MADNTFTRVGEALWGSAWMPAAAEFLQVRRDTVQDYKQGRREPSPAQWDQLNLLIRRRIILLKALEADTLERSAPDNTGSAA